MFTKVLVVAAALTAAVATTAPAQADANISFGVGFGFHDPDYYPVYDDDDDDDGISCWKAKKIVKNHGFYKVHATDCGGKYMRFKGKKGYEWYSIKVNHYGKIVDVDEL